VLVLHALTVSYRFMPSMSGIDSMVDRYDFIGVVPSGRLNGSTPYWDAAPTDDNYDVTFIGSLLDDLERAYCVDPSRVFSLGMSNGAQMSSLLACRMPDRIRAIGAIAGEEYLTPCDGRPVGIMAFHGTADPIVKYAGGGLNATHIADMEYWKGKVPAGLPAPMGIDESMRRWAKHNGCDPNPRERRLTDEVRLRTWTGCAAPTLLYIIDGGGHAWPGKPQPAFEAQFGHGTTDIDASDLMFRFFFGDS
jgi:polyhydroxybutyrate depolymerase